MRMTWINNHWDSDYIAMAVEKIKETVSLFIWRYPKVISLIPDKMRQYQENEGAHVQGNPANPGDREELPAYMSLADQYGLDDDMYIRKPRVGRQTVDEEYRVYVAEAPSDEDTDPLKFWEVGGDSDINGS